MQSPSKKCFEHPTHVNLTDSATTPTTGSKSSTKSAKDKSDPPGTGSLLHTAKIQVTMALRHSGVKLVSGVLVVIGIALLPAGVGGALIVGGLALWLISAALTAAAQRESHTIPGSIAWSLAMGVTGAILPLAGIGVGTALAIGFAVSIVGDMLAGGLASAKLPE